MQWIGMEEVGKDLTMRCRAVQKLSMERRKTQMRTRDKSINSEQLEFECQLKTPTGSRIQELLNLRISSPHNLFQSLILAEAMGRHVAELQDHTEGVVVPSILYSDKSTLIDYGPQNNPLPQSHNATHAHTPERERTPRNLKSRQMRRA